MNQLLPKDHSNINSLFLYSNKYYMFLKKVCFYKKFLCTQRTCMDNIKKNTIDCLYCVYVCFSRNASVAHTIQNCWLLCLHTISYKQFLFRELNHLKLTKNGEETHEMSSYECNINLIVPTIIQKLNSSKA